MKKARFQSIIRRLSPPQRIYKNYLQEAEDFCTSFKSLQLSIPVAQRNFSKFALIESKLFQKKYLVCYAKESWFAHTFPGYDALATTSVVFAGILESPPVVIVPAGRKFISPKMCSILEHEIVHVNQAILDLFPSNFEHAKGDLCQEILDYTLREYEANFLQLAKWPVLFPKEGYVTLEEWCVLRGYTQALERFISSGLRGIFSEKKFFAALKNVEMKAALVFTELGASTEVAQRFAQSTRRFSRHAINHIPQDFPEKSLNRFIEHLDYRL